MAQVMAARAIHSSLVCPSFGSLQNKVGKIKPFGFASKVLAREPQNGHRVFRISLLIIAKISAANVVSVSPEDAPKVVSLHTSASSFCLLGLCRIVLVMIVMLLPLLLLLIDPIFGLIHTAPHLPQSLSSHLRSLSLRPVRCRLQI
ncbi:hypothetical protein LOK49_LG06G00904 [Camellia lanceoleosa]|uniref:Uncharacterized protein n=1 Tax=Camellia lanceoleosa TaxID=1840588 RepID=A0ACC0H9B9_9ERIC|nr:hypothetical protein LOK49_LG06G00904 [Camellia lanceoleosa]